MISLSKCFSAVCTFVRLVSKMSEHMLLQIASKPKCFRTLCAGIGFFSTWFGWGRHRPRTYFSRLPFGAEVQDSESFKDSKSHTRFTPTLSISHNMIPILPSIGRCRPISHYPAATYLFFLDYDDGDDKYIADLLMILTYWAWRCKRVDEVSLLCHSVHLSPW